MKERFLKQVKSFSCAFSGIFSVLDSEAHMRFHLVFSIYVIAFALKFYNLSTAQWALMVLTISAVWVTEIINTAIECMCDMITTQYNKNIKYIKDISAGAVLVSAIASVAVGVITLYRPDCFSYMFYYFFDTDIWAVFVLIPSIVISAIFIFLKPSEYKKFFSKKKNETVFEDNKK